MLKPHVTVACVVHAQGKFLVVEETIRGKALWNQPAGHLEADETLAQAAARELWEETGIRAEPQHFLRMHQWIARDRTPFLRFCLLSSLTKCAPLNPRQRYRSLPLGHGGGDLYGDKPALTAGCGKHSLLSELPAFAAGNYRSL